MALMDSSVLGSTLSFCQLSLALKVVTWSSLPACYFVKENNPSITLSQDCSRQKEELLLAMAQRVLVKGSIEPTVLLHSIR